MDKLPDYVIEQNTQPSTIQNSGCISIKQRIQMMQQAGRKIAEHRINSELINIEGEDIEKSIFGLKRYTDKLDICELIKKHKDKIEGIMSTYSLRKAEEAAQKAKDDKLSKSEARKAYEADLERMRDAFLKSEESQKPA